MSIEVHPTAIVHKDALLGDGVNVGPYAIIEKNTVVGKGTKISSHVSIAEGCRIGENCIIHKGAVLASVPQDLKFEGEETILEIGDGTTIREFVTLNRGTSASGKTVIGKNTLIMAYVHVAHDCLIGDNVIIANSVNMGGHVEIQNNATIGGMTPIHQFVKIGIFAFIGGGYRVPKDVPPYILAAGEPLVYRTLNLVGLKRNGFSREAISKLSKGYNIIYDKKTSLEEGLSKLKSNGELTAELQIAVDFFESSSRGIIGSE